jgi:hypothetical protein
MYIPTANFSSQNACVTASVSYVSGNGNITSGSFVSGSNLWYYIQFENTANLTSVSSSFTASLNIPGGYTSQGKILLVGGGGAGGLGAIVPCPTSPADTAGGGGGGGGTVYIDTFALYSGSFEVCVGAGGGPAAQATRRSGANSYIKLPNGADYPTFGNQITAGGGGRGGYVSGPCGIPKTNEAADSGASGGGASRPYLFAQTFGGNGGGIGGLTGPSQGFEGGDCLNSPDGQQFDVQGAGGGGSGAAATNILSPTRAGNGGSGKTFSITGTSLTYGGGGGGAVLRGFPNTFFSGNNGSSTSGFGSGGRAGASFSGNPATSATSGVVVIAWPNYCDTGNFTVYRMQSCCDSGSFYNIAVENGVSFGLGYTIYNPVVSACMKSIGQLNRIENVTFTLTNANTNTYNYGTDSYGGDVQCLNCRQANGLSGCAPIGNTCTTWTFQYTANLPTPPSSVSYVDCTTGNTLSFSLSPVNRNGSACVRTGTTPTWGANIIATQTTSYCGLY